MTHDAPTAKPLHADAGETRQRLLEAAAEIFAREGFHRATIREICRVAGTNVAAVNYHFRDKEQLYLAVIEYSLNLALEKFPPNLGVVAEAPAEERLRAFIHSFLLRLLSEGPAAWHSRIITLEMTQPTPALDFVVENYSRRLFQQLLELVRELAGPQAGADRLRLAAVSIISQCVFWRCSQPVIVRIHPDQQFDRSAIHQIAQHIYEFSLNAIRQIGRTEK